MLTRLLREALRRELALLLKNNIRLQFIGRIDEVDAAVKREIRRAVAATQANTGMTLNIAFNYGGRTEIVDAVRAFVAECRQTGRAVESITDEDVSRLLYTASDPDLLIRTSGELRVSNFLLWQIAYTEIVVTETLWPDFRRIHLLEAVLDFQRRKRRFGGVETEDQQALA